MKTRILAVALLTLTACQADTQPPAEMAEAEAAVAAAPVIEGTQYGEPLTLSQITPVSTIMAAPEEFIGERVLVEGMIVEVCEMKGCWMDIASDAEYEKIQIKVEDGEIVFPLTARGKQAWAEGIVEEISLTHEEAIEDARHKAEEHGTEFDPSTVTGPTTTYRIKGVGVVIAE